jgi:hypothetical protein
MRDVLVRAHLILLVEAMETSASCEARSAPLPYPIQKRHFAPCQMQQTGAPAPVIRFSYGKYQELTASLQ